MDQLTVAVLGTGVMGSGMARSLARAGHRVVAWNRTAARAQALAGDGVTPAADPRQAVVDAAVVVTMLDDEGTTTTVMETALPAMRRGAVWAQMGTVGPEATGRLSALAGAADVGFVDAPVLGTRAPAERGQLLVLASGPGAAREQCRPVFEAVGARTMVLGEEAGPASRLKLVINHWLLVVLAGLAETLTLAEALDLPPAEFLRAIDGSPSSSPMAQAKGAAMLAGDFATSFAVRLAEKGLALVLLAGERGGVELTLAAATAALFARAGALGHGDDDTAAVYAAARPTGDEAARPAPQTRAGSSPPDRPSSVSSR